ncbi:MAG: hypothetical protein WDM96_16870 [Lacunisphaera sp.]
MKKWLAPLFVLTALFALTACENTSAVVSRGLSITVTKIERSAGGSYDVTWQVVNPNVVAYAVDHSEHKLFLDGVLVGTVSRKSAQGVPPQAQAEGTDPLVLAGPAASDKLAQALAQGSANYRVESTIWVLLIDDDLSKSQLISTGTTAVTAK